MKPQVIIVVALLGIFAAYVAGSAIDSRATSMQMSPVSCEDSDVNQDGFVDIIDLNIVKGCLYQPVAGNCTRADVNRDGIINILDMNVVKANLYC